MHAVRRCTPGCIGGVRRGKITRRRRRSAAADKPAPRAQNNLSTALQKPTYLLTLFINFIT